MGAMKKMLIEQIEAMHDGPMTDAEFEAATIALMGGETPERSAPPEWADNADRLADAATRLLRRSDCCGGYRRRFVTTRKNTDCDWLDMPEALRLHFNGQRTIGLHSTSPTNYCRWLAFDIDAHAGESPADNLDAAETIVRRLRREGLNPRLFDSDGRGGIHIWVILPRAIRSQRAFAMVRDAAADLNVKVECFPKQPEIREGGFGNWIRLPGRHHKRNHWSRVRIGNRWGSAAETIDAILEMCRCRAIATC